MAHKSGFVNILGNPNVGKSTLMNALVGEKLSVITSKSQTTRHRIMGIVNGEDFQVVFSDTPGIIKPNYLLQESMMKFVSNALTDADLVLLVTDIVESPGKNPDYIEKLKNSKIPVIVLINKIDLSDQSDLENLVNFWHSLLPEAEILPISALKSFNVQPLFKRILEVIPEFPPYFPKDQLTDKTERFFAGEIIRGKILENYQQEVPYSVEIEIESFQDTERIVNIAAVIHVARDSQKGIIIGHKGSKLKKVGMESRLEMEAFFGKKVFLEMFVKVNKDWRDSKNKLKSFGYE
ncbi:MAG: GTPase Era [Bacteroidales bacterium]|nr:GTPase Era [Bacteroidales bacterium]